MGETAQLKATGTYADSSTEDVTAKAVWASSNALVGTIDASGLATGVSIDKVTLTASLNGARGTVDIFVMEPHWMGLLLHSDLQYKGLPTATPRGDLSILPALFDLSSEFPAPGNQGKQNCCVTWAVGYALKSYQEGVKRGWSLSDVSHLMSPAFIFSQTKIDGGSTGSYMEDALDLLLVKGVSSLATMPYDSSDYSAQPSNAAYTEALQYRISSWSRIDEASISGMKGFIVNGQPVLAAIKVFPDFDNLTPTNDTYNNTAGAFRGYHAVVLVGYDDSKQAFKALSSWGTNWGVGGYGWIAYALFPEVVTRAYVTVEEP